MRFAAVDIGSNAVRLLFCEVYPGDPYPTIKKITLIRLPIRLGQDVFVQGDISDTNISKLSKTLHSFKLLVDVYDVIDYRICATSAMREAKNGEKVIQSIKKEVGMNIEIIDGKEEAQLIFDTHIAEKLDQTGTYLYIDVGGGSTELTLFSNGEKITSNSFKIGTIRLKNKIVSDEDWEEMKNWIQEMKAVYQVDMTIGTGGNINKLYKLCGLENYQLLEYDDLSKMDKFIGKYSIEERIAKLDLRADRADVITHAAKIYLTVMKEAATTKMFVPKVGLADGIIYQLYNKIG